MSRDPSDDFWKFVRQMLEKFDREFELGFSEMEVELMEDPEVSGFHIEVRDEGEGEPEIRVERLGEHFEKRPHEMIPIREVPAEGSGGRKEHQIQPIRETLETNTTKAEKPNEVVLVMQAPDVKEENVTIRRLGRSLEIIARRTGDRAYFATFELPPDADLEQRTLEINGDMLIVTVPRRTFG